MDRITQRTSQDKVTIASTEQEAFAKLASYEDVHEAVLKEYDRVSEQINQAKRKDVCVVLPRINLLLRKCLFKMFCLISSVLA